MKEFGVNLPDCTPPGHCRRTMRFMLSIIVRNGYFSSIRRAMDDTLTITYYASRDNLGVVSDEEYMIFKKMLLEALQDEWPDAQVAVEDDEDAVLEVNGLTGQAEQDVRDRIEDIVNDLVESAAWQDEDDDFLLEEEETQEDENEEY